jgi:hypothetical protein
MQSLNLRELYRSHCGHTVGGPVCRVRSLCDTGVAFVEAFADAFTRDR